MKKALILGGTFPHRELIRQLKVAGYKTYLVDYLENPIAAKVADCHIRESTLDKEVVLGLAQSECVDLVISSCVDQANVTACYVGEKLNLPHPYSYETALNVTDKSAMKQIMAATGIPTSKHRVFCSMQEFSDCGLVYPIIVKPADGNSSKGVRRIDKHDPDKLIYAQKALAQSRNGKAVVEEFKIGKEVGVDCIIKNSRATVIMTRERRKITDENDAIQQIYGSIWPADLSESQLDQLREIAEHIALAFHLDNTPLMIQTIVGEKEINVIEFGARIGGGENYRIIKELTGFDFIAQSINSFLHREIVLDFYSPTQYLADNYIYTRPCIFGGMEIPAEVGSELLYYNELKQRGTEVGCDISSNNRVGSFVVAGRTKKECLCKIERVINEMRVYDIYGKSVMRRDFYQWN